MSTGQEWADLRGTLPDHQAELMAAHQGTGGTGDPAPAADHGMSEQQKYEGRC